MLISPDIVADIVKVELGMPDFTDVAGSGKELFSKAARKSWHAGSQEVARCDFAPNKAGLHPRAGVWFHSLWKRSAKGRTLSDIKEDGAMADFFAQALAPFIAGVLGGFLAMGGFAMVTTPARRHKVGNFGERTACAIASRLGIPFFPACAVARSCQRIGAVFDEGNIPPQRNIIVFDDIVTTGSTLSAMDTLLRAKGKNCFFVVGINNQL